jgi:hypothetical protein
MNKFKTYAVSCLMLACVTIFVVWFGYGIADACNACLTRAGHAVLVRDKMRRCTVAYYKRLSTEYAADTVHECNQGDITWSPVCSESYGPQRHIKKRERRIKTIQKKRPRSHHVPRAEHHTDIMTHRNAPFSLPLARGSFWLSSRFGPRQRADGSSGFHYGIDLAANRGTPVYAARAGVVLYAGHDNGYGKTIVLQHGQFKTRYAHLDRIDIRTGDTVARGARIGTVGATGNVRKKGGDGSHLHFEIYYQGKRVDPLQFLPDFVS